MSLDEAEPLFEEIYASHPVNKDPTPEQRQRLAMITGLSSDDILQW